jgi:hypothetical protein
MVKTTKLSQVLASEKLLKTNGYPRITQIYKTFQKASLFDGHSKTYRPKDEGDETLPPEKRVVQEHAADLLKEVVAYMVKLTDHEAAKDYANCSAKADVVLGGEVLISQAPATLLLFLEKQLRDLRAEVSKMPTLDAGQDWSYDDAIRMYKTPLVQNHKTKKIPTVIKKFDPTEHQPGQAEIFHEDRVVGYWETVNLSSAISASTQHLYLERIDALTEAVKHARSQVNETPAPEVTIGKKFFDYVFGS